jgi:hypothetical protein
MAQFYIYLGIAFLITFFLIKKAKPTHTVISFVICYWLFVGDVANMDGVKISLGAFDLQPLRILFLLSTAFLIFYPLLNQYKKTGLYQLLIKVSPVYEKYLLVYIILVIISLFVNSSLFTASEFVAIFTTVLSFPLIYFMVKRAADEGFVEAFRNALFCVAAISSLVAIYQFVGDQSFFRVNPEFHRTAFGGFIRSTGVFRDDYIHAYVVFSALVWAGFSISEGPKKYLLIALFLIGIFVGFMRMGYVVTAFFVVHAILFASNVSKKLKVLIVSLGSIAGVILIFGVLGSGILESDVAQERMMDEDTMTLRFSLYEQGIKASFGDIHGMLFGYGSPNSPQYYESMYKATGGHLGWANGEVGSWHNLLVEILFFNGLPALIFFLMFIIFYLKYFFRLAVYYPDYHYRVSTYLLSGYIIANLTLDLGLENPFAIIMGISAALAVGKRKIQLQKEEIHDLEAV